ncbi:MAG: hypothetical protein RLZZ395_1376, partial [Pseudomonadota bacterium]
DRALLIDRLQQGHQRMHEPRLLRAQGRGAAVGIWRHGGAWRL